MIKRTTMSFRKDWIREVTEYHDGRYGAPGASRRPKKRATPEQIARINAINKTKRCRWRLLEYFHPGDVWATWTYAVRNRPPDMQTALKDFQRAMTKVRREYKKRGMELFWIRNIEQGTKGAWHIHLVINEIGDTGSIIQKAWTHGGTWINSIKDSGYYSEDMEDLAGYLTKDENTVTYRVDGTPERSKLRQANYNISRNMPLPPPKEKKLVRWKKEIKPPKDFYIAKLHEGITPLGFLYRTYTLIRLNRRP